MQRKSAKVDEEEDQRRAAECACRRLFCQSFLFERAAQLFWPSMYVRCAMSRSDSFAASVSDVTATGTRRQSWSSAGPTRHPPQQLYESGEAKQRQQKHEHDSSQSRGRHERGSRPSLLVLSAALPSQSPLFFAAGAGAGAAGAAAGRDRKAGAGRNGTGKGRGGCKQQAAAADARSRQQQAGETAAAEQDHSAAARGRERRRKDSDSDFSLADVDLWVLQLDVLYGGAAGGAGGKGRCDAWWYVFHHVHRRLPSVHWEVVDRERMAQAWGECTVFLHRKRPEDWEQQRDAREEAEREEREAENEDGDENENENENEDDGGDVNEAS